MPAAVVAEKPSVARDIARVLGASKRGPGRLSGAGYVVTWAIGRSGLSGLWLALLVLIFALIKGQLVGDWFMGLRGLRGIWRWVVVIWLLIPGALITSAFVLSYGS